MRRRAFILYIPTHKQFYACYATEEQYREYAEGLELQPHYNEAQVYAAVEREIHDYMRGYAEAQRVVEAEQWVALALKKIVWSLRLA